MTLKRLCSCFDAALPRLGKLICFEIFVVMSKEAFVTGSEVVLEEIDHVEKPAEIDILLPFPNKYRLSTRCIIRLEL
jgi:hypothetical protein